MVVLVFLRNVRSTLVSAVALPTAIIGTFAVMKALGFTFNIVTMLALTLSIGLLIDDAIVVIENIVRHLEHGESPKVAAEKGTGEIALAVLAVTLAVVAVFVPVAFMEGMMGRFFYQFGVTVAVAVLISYFVSMTLTPMLSARLLNEHVGQGPVSPGHRAGAAGHRGRLPPRAGLAARPPRHHRGRRRRWCWSPPCFLATQAQVHLHAPAGHERGEGDAGDAVRHHRSPRPSGSSTSSPCQLRDVPGVTDAFSIAGGGAPRGGQQGGDHRQLRPHRRAALRPAGR